MKEKKKREQPFLEELELGLRAPVRLWGNSTVYAEDCCGILDLGADYIRFLSGRTPVTVFGTELRVEEYRQGRLMVRGKFTSVEFG